MLLQATPAIVLAMRWHRIRVNLYKNKLKDLGCGNEVNWLLGLLCAYVLDDG